MTLYKYPGSAALSTLLLFAPSRDTCEKVAFVPFTVLVDAQEVAPRTAVVADA